MNNKKGLFYDVDNNQKFVMLFLSAKYQSEQVLTYGWAEKFDESVSENLIELPSSVFEEFDRQCTYYLDNNTEGLGIYQKFLNNSAIFRLSDLDYHFWTEYHATNDSNYFSDQNGSFILFSGKAINQYDYLSKSWLEKHGRSALWKAVDFPKDLGNYRTEYYVNEIPDRIIKHHNSDDSRYRIVIQDVTGTVNNIRTSYATILPKKHFTTNTLNNLFIGNDDSDLVFYCCILNSFIFDWLARMKVATYLNKFIIDSLLVSKIDAVEELVRDDIIRKGLSLLSVSNDFDPLTNDILQIDSHDEILITDSTDRQKTKNELDLLVAKIYNLSKDDLQVIMDSFPLVKRGIVNDILTRYGQKNE